MLLAAFVGLFLLAFLCCFCCCSVFLLALYYALVSKAAAVVQAIINNCLSALVFACQEFEVELGRVARGAVGTILRFAPPFGNRMRSEWLLRSLKPLGWAALASLESG